MLGAGSHYSLHLTAPASSPISQSPPPNALCTHSSLPSALLSPSLSSSVVAGAGEGCRGRDKAYFQNGETFILWLKSKEMREGGHIIDTSKPPLRAASCPKKRWLWAQRRPCATWADYSHSACCEQDIKEAGVQRHTKDTKFHKHMASTESTILSE